MKPGMKFLAGLFIVFGIVIELLGVRLSVLGLDKTIPEVQAIYDFGEEWGIRVTYIMLVAGMVEFSKVLLELGLTYIKLKSFHIARSLRVSLRIFQIILIFVTGSGVYGYFFWQADEKMNKGNQLTIAIENLNAEERDIKNQITKGKEQINGAKKTFGDTLKNEENVYSKQLQVFKDELDRIDARYNPQISDLEEEISDKQGSKKSNLGFKKEKMERELTSQNEIIADYEEQITVTRKNLTAAKNCPYYCDENEENLIKKLEGKIGKLEKEKNKAVAKKGTIRAAYDQAVENATSKSKDQLTKEIAQLRGKIAKLKEEQNNEKNGVNEKIAPLEGNRIATSKEITDQHKTFIETKQNDLKTLEKKVTQEIPSERRKMQEERKQFIKDVGPIRHFAEIIAYFRGTKAEDEITLAYQFWCILWGVLLAFLGILMMKLSLHMLLGDQHKVEKKRLENLEKDLKEGMQHSIQQFKEEQHREVQALKDGMGEQIKTAVGDAVKKTEFIGVPFLQVKKEEKTELRGRIDEKEEGLT